MSTLQAPGAFYEVYCNHLEVASSKNKIRIVFSNSIYVNAFLCWFEIQLYWNVILKADAEFVSQPSMGDMLYTHYTNKS